MASYSKVYLNPNLDPDRYYVNLKAYCLLYDQVFIWSPSLVLLEKHNVEENDFLALCQPGRFFAPVIVPSARQNWHDAASTNTERRFRSRILAISERQKLGIAPLTDYEKGYCATDETFIKHDSIARDQFRKSLLSLVPDNEYHIEQMQDVAKKLKKPFEWAILNTYSQDILACRTLGASSPIITHKLLDGFRFFVDQDERNELPSTDSANVDPHKTIHTSAFQRLDVDIRKLSASQILDFRRKYLPGLRKLLDDANYKLLLDKNEDECKKLADAFIDQDIQHAYRLFFNPGGGILSRVAVLLASIIVSSTYKARLVQGVAEIINWRAPYRRLLLSSNSSAEALVKILGADGR